MFKSFASFLIDNKYDQKNLALSEILSILAIFLIFLVSLNGVYPNTNFFGIDKVKGLSFFNQALWTFVFCISFVAVVISKRVKSSYFVVSLPLILFCLFFFLSAIWSLAPLITIRRSTLELFVMLTISFSVLNVANTENILNIFYRVSQYVLCLNIIMLLMLNGFDESGFFHGVHFQKNYTGVVAAFSIIVGFWRYFSRPENSNIFVVSFIVSWAILLLLSQSKTSLGLLIITPILFYFLRLFNKKVSISIFIMVLFFFVVYSFLTIFGYSVTEISSAFVNDVGFTGRDDIWLFLIGQIEQRPWLGFGYGGFWDIGYNSPNIVYGTGYVPFIGQAHNGYIDIVINVGFVGLFFFLLLFIHLLIITSNITKTKTSGVIDYCLLFVIFSLLHNFTESSFIRAYSFVWVMHLFSISIIYKEYVNIKNKL